MSVPLVFIPSITKAMFQSQTFRIKSFGSVTNKKVLLIDSMISLLTQWCRAVAKTLAVTMPTWKYWCKFCFYKPTPHITLLQPPPNTTPPAILRPPDMGVYFLLCGQNFPRDFRDTRQRNIWHWDQNSKAIEILHQNSSFVLWINNSAGNQKPRTFPIIWQCQNKI